VEVTDSHKLASLLHQDRKSFIVKAPQVFKICHFKSQSRSVISAERGRDSHAS